MPKLTFFDKTRRIYHRLPRWIKVLLWIALFLVALSIYPTLAELPARISTGGKASLSIQLPSTQNLEPGHEFPLEIHLRTGGQAVNAVGLTAHFDPLNLEVLQMNTGNSFCSFYTENSFDTIRGDIHLSCGTPSPGFEGDSTLATLIMRPKQRGSSEITILPNAMALANDGKGTNILRSSSVSTILTVKQSF